MACFTTAIVLIPALSMPNGFAAPPGGGTPLPVGFQLAGPAFSENSMLEVAFALEQALGFDGSAVRR